MVTRHPCSAGRTRPVASRRLVLLSALLLACLAVVASCGPKAQDHYNQAKVHYEKGDLAKAEAEARQATELDPKHAPAYELLGRIQYRQRQVREAHATLSKAVQLNPNLLDAQLTLGEVLLLMGRTSEAARKADLVLAKRRSGEALLFKAALERSQGRVDEALKWCRQAMAKEPKLAEGYLLAAELLGETKDLAQAEAVLQAGVAKVAEPLPLQVSLAQVYAAQGKGEEAQGLVTGLVAKHPADPKLRLLLAEYYGRQGNTGAAEAELRQAVKLRPTEEPLRTALADFLIAAGRVKEAEEELSAAVNQVKPGYALRSRLARLYALTGRLEQAAAAYQAAAALDPRRPEAVAARCELAALHLETRQVDKALAELEAVLKGNPAETRALLLKGKALLAKGEAVQATGALKAAVAAQPQATEPYVLLAQAQVMTGQPKEAKETLRQGLAAIPEARELRRALVRVSLAENDLSTAKAELDRLLAADPKDAGAWTDLGSLHVARGEMNQAERCFRKVAELNPKDHLTQYRLGLLAGQQGRFEEARRHFGRCLELSPDFGIAATAMVQTYLARQEQGKALKWLEARLAARPQDAWLHNMMGELKAMTGEAAAAERHFVKAQAAAVGWATPYNNLVLLYARTGQVDQAASRLKGEFKAKRSVRAGHLLAMLQETQRDYGGARQTYEQVLSLDPEFILSANNLAFLLAEVFPGKDTLGRADKLSQQVLAQAPGDPYVLDTAGWVAYRRGDLSKAKTLLERALAHQPQVAVFNYHLGMVYLKERDNAQAKRCLERALQSGQGFLGMEEAKKALDKLG